jgi:hypothetical protein
VSHAALPTLLPDGAGAWTLFASSRDADGRASIGRTGVRMTPEARLDGPGVLVLAPGGLGAFEDGGVAGGCVVAPGGARWRY